VTFKSLVTNESERRREQRIREPFPARVEGVDTDGKSFEADTVIDNINTDCLYVRLLPPLERGANLSVAFRLSVASGKSATSARVELKGEVIRVDSIPADVRGVVVAYKLRRFYFAKPEISGVI
jgi:hypothetical protein